MTTTLASTSLVYEKRVEAPQESAVREPEVGAEGCCEIMLGPAEPRVEQEDRNCQIVSRGYCWAKET